MPRMRTPKGYYTMTDATKTLNISASMVRKYVEKGRISYLLPEGRSHGFYLKKDVDQLSNEINAFLTIEGGEVEFKAANKDELQGIVRIANNLFSNDKTGNPTVPSWRYEVLEKNTETQFVLKRDNAVIGFTTILPFKPGSRKLKEVLTADRVSDINLSPGDIEDFKPGNKIHLYIAGIGIDPSIDKYKRKEYGARLVRDLIATIVDLGARGVIVEKLFAQGATRAGVRLLQSFGLHETASKASTKRVFTMDIQESGSRVSMQYKQAFAEHYKP